MAPNLVKQLKTVYPFSDHDYIIANIEWEPQWNLRFCPESLEAYERGQRIGHNEKGKEQCSDDDEGAEDYVNMRKKKTSKRGKRKTKKRQDGPPSKKQMAIKQPAGDTHEEEEYLLANFIAHLIQTTNTEMALAAIKQNFDDDFSSFEHRKVHVQLILLNYLEICSKLNEDNHKKDTVMSAKAIKLGIEALRVAEEGNNSTMANNLVKEVDSTLKLVWLANLDLINQHPLLGMREELAKLMRGIVKEKAPKWEMEMAASQNAGKNKYSNLRR